MSTTPVGNDAILFNITGQNVGLGPLQRDFIPLYQRWLNNLHHGRNFGDTPEPWSIERMTALFDSRAVSTNEMVFFTIYTLAEVQPIGYTMLVDISFRHRSAEFGIHIGEDAAHGKGYATETTRLMLDYAFRTLGLRSVFLLVAEFNHAGQRAYTRAGFRESGRRRQALQMGGRYWDQIIMDCLADEYIPAISTQPT